MKKIGKYAYMKLDEMIEFVKNLRLNNAEDALLLMLLYYGVGKGKYENIINIKKTDIQGNRIYADGIEYKIDPYTKSLIDKTLEDDEYVYYGDGERKYIKNLGCEYVFMPRPQKNNSYGLEQMSYRALKQRFTSLKSLYNFEFDMNTLRISKIVYDLLKEKKEWTVREISTYNMTNDLNVSDFKIYKLVKDCSEVEK